MKSRLQFAGHPIHTMVVGFPIGLYSTALLCDILYLLLADAFWFRMAFWAILFGLVTHLGAAATGLPDFLAVMKERQEGQDLQDLKGAQRAATSHLVFGIGLLVVQGLNLAVRHGGEVPPGGSIAMPLIVNVIGAALTGLQGWYGGELVFRHHVGVELPEAPLPGHQGKPKEREKGPKFHY
ncbi:MAG: DUF2231 domain-containing protein [Nitrospirota bacterium]